MNRYRSAFPKVHTFLAVVHAVSEAQALANARIAREGGADGIFLINHAITSDVLLRCYEAVMAEMPGLWIGLNCLDLGRSAIGVIPQTVAGLWTDNAGIEEGGVDCTVSARRFADLRQKCGWKGVYFGGTAFKYQEPVRNVAAVAAAAIPFVDVITTSGEETGVAPEVGKIATMKRAIGDYPLAIASGITAANVRSFMPFADCFLVATGISRSPTELDSSRIRSLADQLNH